MTEEEAKEKWCPMAAALESGTSQKCIGSECMAWVRDEGYIAEHGEIKPKLGGHCGMVK